MYLIVPKNPVFQQKGAYYILILHDLLDFQQFLLYTLLKKTKQKKNQLGKC